MNRLLRAVATSIVTTLLAGLLATTASAQGQGTVIESQAITPGSNSISSSPSSNNDALQLLLDQNRQLQAELQALRGMVEEQGFEIRRLQRDSLSRYTDMDERLQSLESGAAATTTAGVSTAIPASPISNTPASVAGSSNEITEPSIGALNAGTASANSGIANSRPIATPRNSRNSSSRGTLQPAVLSEQQLYQMAYDSVINSDFELSIAEFDQYLSIYPQGRFVTNAHYWKGQAYLFLRRYGEARDSYEMILNQYDDSAKLPDAMYGLAQAYEGLGNVPQARQLLNDIKRQFPNTGAASLADTRLLTLD